MRLIFYFFLLSFSSNILLAQVSLYHRVKIVVEPIDYEKLAQIGIAIDHGDHSEKNSFTTDLSQEEVDRLNIHGITHQVEIYDVSKFYVQRNEGISEKQVNLLSGSCKDCPSFSTPQNFTLGSMGGFYTYQEMLDILDSMAMKYPNLISTKQALSSNLSTWEGRPIYYVKISDNVATDEPENELLYTSLHHAREVQSLSQLIFYMWYLLENYGVNPEVTYLVDNLEIYFVPCLNPDGYIYNETTNPNGGGMWRKNRRPFPGNVFGVDLNRNYGFNWGFDDFGSSPDSTTDVHRGPYPFSEPETQMIRDFCNQHQFQLAVNNHTYSNLLIYPWGYQPATYTPDSATFVQFAEKMVKCSGFTYGTADQTVGYVVNGSSDDWMYGEQISKPKIFAMTPEAGNSQDGFWPAINRIVDISKSTMDQNLYAARICTKYSELEEQDNFFVSSTTFFQKFKLKRLGLVGGNFQVSVVPISSNVISSNGPIPINNSNQFQLVTDSVQISLSPSVSPGDLISFKLLVDNGFYQVVDTINLIFGSPVSAFFDAGNSTSNWQSSGGTWVNSSSVFVSPSSSIADSPFNYSSNLNKSITTVSSINLTDALAAELSYFARWDIETNYDYAQILISANGGSFVPLCGKYTKTGNGNQDFGNPVYDGLRTNWVKESIDLNPFIGQNIKLRFNLVSDFYQNGDGIYLDDIQVTKIVNPNGVQEELVKLSDVKFYPNPCENELIVSSRIKSEEMHFLLMDITGRVLLDRQIDLSQGDFTLSLGELSSGIYSAVLMDGNGRKEVRKIIVQH